MIGIEIIFEKDFFSLLTDFINFSLAIINIYYSGVILYKTKEKYQFVQLFMSSFYVYLLYRYSILGKLTVDIDVLSWFVFEAMVFMIFIYDNHKKLKKIKYESNISQTII